MSDPKWETISEEDGERTERLKVPSGYIYRSVMWDVDSSGYRVDGPLTQSMVFVPHTPIRVKTG